MSDTLKYLLPIIITLLTAASGGYFSAQGLKEWYQTIKLPTWAPSGKIIGPVWFTIYVLATISAILTLLNSQNNGILSNIINLFLVNAFLNAFWSYLFFFKHKIGAAILDSVLIGLTVMALIVMIWPFSILAASLLVPYAAWVTFATYLNYLIWKLNR